MRYEDAMKYITEIGNFGSSYGLERTYRLLELLGNPQESLKLIHIAGTNGKGSTTAMITKILCEAGFKVGMYTSPFIEEFEERIQINGVNIPKEKLAELVEELKIVVDKVIEEGYDHPTEFEIITVLMLLYFKKECVDFAIVEVGLGGRLDSTNVINPLISVITSISFDHTNILGNTLTEIAGEKAGVIKKDTPTVIFPQVKEVYDVILEKCKKENSKLYVVDKNDIVLKSINKSKTPYQTVEIIKDNSYQINLPLLGKHQVLNLGVALKVIEVLNSSNIVSIDEEVIKSAIANVKWMGRLEVLKSNPTIVIDGAHNIQGIKVLTENIQKYFEYKDLYLILGILADKDVKEMVNTIVPIAKKVYAVTPHSDRAELAKDLKEEVVKVNKNCEYYNEYNEALNTVMKEAKEDDLILASGSLYMIGDMRKLIRKSM